MTELVDLITDPKQRMTVLMDKFIANLEERHKKEERQLDQVMEHFRLKLHRQHQKAVYSYKKILDEIYAQQVKNKDAPILEFFERFIRAEDKSMYTEVFDKAIPVIQEIEKEGGQLHCSIQKMGYGSSGCLYSNRSDGHFSFFEEDFEGFDETMEFKVVKMSVDEKTKRLAKEKEEEEWRQRLLAKQGPKNEVILEDLKDVKSEEPVSCSKCAERALKDDPNYFINRILRDLEEPNQPTEDLATKTFRELEEQEESTND